MPEPEKKAPKIDKLLDGILKLGNGTPRKITIEKSGCVFCPEVVITGRESFKDDLSWKEYKISGLCQGCQDDVF